MMMMIMMTMKMTTTTTMIMMVTMIGMLICHANIEGFQISLNEGSPGQQCR